MIECIVPKNEQEWLNLRVEDITSTEVAALFGVSPYMTLFELWHRKKNKTVVEIEQNDRMKWGTRLQDSIAAGIAEDQGWTVRRMDEYIRNPNLRMGSSFDFEIMIPVDEGAVRKAMHDGDSAVIGDAVSEKTGLLEIKNVDSLAFMQGWAVEGDDIEAPPHIELQVQHQLAVTGRTFAYIGALVGGNTVKLIKREPDAKIIEAIRTQVASFWFSIAADKEPTPDFVRDAAFIARLYGYAEPDKIFDARGDANILSLVEKYRHFSEQEKKAKEERDAIKAQLLMTIGDAEKVTADGFSITANMVGPAHVEYDREGYRQFRVNWKKGKK